MLIPKTECQSGKSKTLLLSLIPNGYSKEECFLRETNSTNHGQAICSDISGQTLRSDWETWFLFFPNSFWSLGHFTTSTSIQEKDGPYLFGLQVINLKNEIKKRKIIQGTLSSQKYMLFTHELFFHLQTQPIRKPPEDRKTLCYLIILKINFGLIMSIINKLFI
jgi:hypothetical protein